ncbi:hypothetical protein Plhal304r1_c004g0018191 [Plasmopara halstedii]
MGKRLRLLPPSRRKNICLTPTNAVVASYCWSVGVTDHKCDAPTRCVAEHTHVKEVTEFVGRGTATLALDAVKFAGELVPP